MSSLARRRRWNRIWPIDRIGIIAGKPGSHRGLHSYVGAGLARHGVRTIITFATINPLLTPLCFNPPLCVNLRPSGTTIIRQRETGMSDELRLGRERRFLVLLGIICLALIGGALYMQVVLGEAPCPLCILQRYALLLIAVFAFIGAAMRRKGAVTFFEGLVVLSALGGVAAAGHHVYTQFFP